jgi:hypothetical protein
MVGPESYVFWRYHVRDEEGVLGRDFLGGGTEYKVVSGLYLGTDFSIETAT